jgi:hypothetical protein
MQVPFVERQLREPLQVESWRRLFLIIPRDRCCADPRDRIFGVLGLTDGSDAWPVVNYRLTMEELFAHVISKFAQAMAQGMYDPEKDIPAYVKKFASDLVDKLALDESHPVIVRGITASIEAVEKTRDPINEVHYGS